MAQGVRWQPRFSNYLKALDKPEKAIDYISGIAEMVGTQMTWIKQIYTDFLNRKNYN